MKRIALTSVAVVAAASVVPLAFVLTDGSVETATTGYKLVDCPTSGYKLVNCPGYQLVDCCAGVVYDPKKEQCCPAHEQEDTTTDAASENDQGENTTLPCCPAVSTTDGTEDESSCQSSLSEICTESSKMTYKSGVISLDEQCEAEEKECKCTPCQICITQDPPGGPPITVPWNPPWIPPGNPPKQKDPKNPPRKPGGGGGGGGNHGGTGGYCKTRFWHDDWMCTGYKDGTKQSIPAFPSICEVRKDGTKHSCCIFTEDYSGIACAKPDKSGVQERAKVCQDDVWEKLKEDCKWSQQFPNKEKDKTSLSGIFYDPCAKESSKKFRNKEQLVEKVDLKPLCRDYLKYQDYLKLEETLENQLNKKQKDGLAWDSIDVMCAHHTMGVDATLDANCRRWNDFKGNKSASSPMYSWRLLMESLKEKCTAASALCFADKAEKCLSTCSCLCDAYHVPSRDETIGGTSCCYNGRYTTETFENVKVSLEKYISCTNCTRVYPDVDVKSECSKLGKICCNPKKGTKEWKRAKKRLHANGQEATVGRLTGQTGDPNLQYCPSVCCEVAGCKWTGEPNKGTCDCEEAFGQNIVLDSGTCRPRCDEDHYETLCDGKEERKLNNQGKYVQCEKGKLVCQKTCQNKKGETKECCELAECVWEEADDPANSKCNCKGIDPAAVLNKTKCQPKCRDTYKTVCYPWYDERATLLGDYLPYLDADLNVHECEGKLMCLEQQEYQRRYDAYQAKNKEGKDGENTAEK